MQNINGYLVEELTSDNSGFAKWGFGTKNGKRYFIKEFLSPVYPRENVGLSPAMLEAKRNVCRQFEYNKRVFYNRLNECLNGNIVTIIDFFRFGSKYYMVTDMVDASEIEPEEIAALPFENKMLVLKILLHCFNILHEHEIVHGDIKPTNILFKKTQAGFYTVKIIDFDSSFLETNPPEGEEFQCDLVYLAPEAFLFMAGHEVKLTTKIDVFALGVLLHQYLSGRLPGYDPQYDYIFEAVLDGGQLDIDPNIPSNLRECIIRMLSREPEDRPTIKDLFSHFVGEVAAAPAHETPAPQPEPEPVVHHVPAEGTFVPRDVDRSQPPKMTDYFSQAGDLL